MPAPIGVGVFCREHSGMGPPERAAVRAEAAGLRHVALMAVWQERGTSIIRNRSSMMHYAEAFDDHGIQVRLWGYPWRGLEAEFSAALRLHKANCPGLLAGVIVNPELGYRHDFAGPAEVLMHRVLDALDESMDLWVSSYGHPEGIRDFPWSTFGGWGHGSPQLYLDKGKAQIRAGLEGWKEHWVGPGQYCIPGIPLYGENDEDRLRPWLEDLLEVYQEVFSGPCPGVIGWSWPQLSDAEVRVLRWLSSELDARWPAP